MSVAGLVDMICHKMGTTLEESTMVAPERPGKDRVYELDSNRIRQLGWVDRVELSEGIDDVIQWVHANWHALKDLPMEYVHRP